MRMQPNQSGGKCKWESTRDGNRSLGGSRNEVAIADYTGEARYGDENLGQTNLVVKYSENQSRHARE